MDVVATLDVDVLYFGQIVRGNDDLVSLMVRCTGRISQRLLPGTADSIAGLSTKATAPVLKRTYLP